MRIGILHPGQMGSMVALSLKNGGHQVYWASENRSGLTRKRAEELQLQDAGSLAKLCAACEIIFSVCPPEFADETADAALRSGFRGLFVDANAISPRRVIRIEARMRKGGARFADGGIIGPALKSPGRTWMYLSGEHAPEAAGCLSAGPMQPRVIEGGAGRASAFKMCYAAYNKGATALLGAVLAAAERLEVRDLLEERWRAGDSQFTPREYGARLANAAPKAWRFAPEMREIADTFEAAGVPPGFHRAAAEMFARLAGFKDSTSPDFEEMVKSLAAPPDEAAKAGAK